MTQKKDDDSASTFAGPKFYRIVRGNLIEEKSRQFYEGDTYVIDNDMEIFIWMGKDSTVDEEFAGAYAAEQLDMARRGAPKVTTIDQGKEPKKLLELLGPNFKTMPGGVESMLTKVEPQKEVATTLYKLSDDKLTKVQLKRSAMGSHDCLVLELPKVIYVWEGKDSSAKDKYNAGHAARDLNSKRKFMVPIKVATDGEEPPEFLDQVK